MAASASERAFGFPTRVRECPPGSTLTTTMSQVFRNDPNRVFWHVVNLGTGTMHLAYNRQVAGTHGMRLVAGGGFVTSTVDEDGEVVGHDVYGISSALNDPVYFFEILRTPRKVT